MSVCTSCEHDNVSDALFCGRCGAQVEDIQTLPEGTMVGGERYRIDALLGVGGMGSVYKATDIGLQRTVALKLLNPELTAHPTARRRMLQEARILARIQHPNVVQVRSVFEEGSVLAMELEFMPGGDLLGAIPDDGMSEDEAIRIMRDVLAGLHALHDAGLVHRDVKPDNVLLASDGTAKITDLGIAHDASSREKTRLGAVLGTPEYMSPEQIQGHAVDRRSDLYSAGILLYRILTGNLPYRASSEFEWQVAHVQQTPNLGSLQGTFSHAIVHVVSKALAKTPEHRWQTAEQMSEGLSLPEPGAVSGVARSTTNPGGIKPSHSPGTDGVGLEKWADTASRQFLQEQNTHQGDTGFVEVQAEPAHTKARATKFPIRLAGGFLAAVTAVSGLALLFVVGTHAAGVSDTTVANVEVQNTVEKENKPVERKEEVTQRKKPKLLINNIEKAKALVDKMAGRMEAMLKEVEGAGGDQAKIKTIGEEFKTFAESNKVEGEALNKALTPSEKKVVDAYARKKMAPLMNKFMAIVMKNRPAP